MPAAGSTLLVCLTNRPAELLFERCEEEFEEDFDDIDASCLADPLAGWPADVAIVLRQLARTAGGGLCHQSKRKRIGLPAVLERLRGLAADAASAAGAAAVVGTAAAAGAPGAAGLRAGAEDGRGSTGVAATSAAPPTALSMQVRALRKGDPGASLRQNMLSAFGSLMEQLDRVFIARASDAPAGFEDRINFWHSECGMGASLKHDLHKLRIWGNAARHKDTDRWRRDGPRSLDEASLLVAAVDNAIAALRPAKKG